MRKSREEKVLTRERIVVAAATKFRMNGLAATGLSDLMGAAGLTHGGFYKHFSSKEEVVNEAAHYALTERLQSFELSAAEKNPDARLSSMVTEYLSMAHRDNRSDGCLLAALGSELVRANGSIKELAADQFTALVALIEGFLPEDANYDKHECATAITTTLLGALTMARITTNTEQAEKILCSARNQILANCQ